MQSKREGNRDGHKRKKQKSQRKSKSAPPPQWHRRLRNFAWVVRTAQRGWRGMRRTIRWLMDVLRLRRNGEDVPTGTRHGDVSALEKSLRKCQEEIAAAKWRLDDLERRIKGFEERSRTAGSGVRGEETVTKDVLSRIDAPRGREYPRRLDPLPRQQVQATVAREEIVERVLPIPGPSAVIRQFVQGGELSPPWEVRAVTVAELGDAVTGRGLTLVPAPMTKPDLLLLHEAGSEKAWLFVSGVTKYNREWVEKLWGNVPEGDVLDPLECRATRSGVDEWTPVKGLVDG